MNGCTQVDHDRARRSTDEWRTATERQRPWPGEGLELAECKRCSSTLSRQIRTEEENR
jgi:hypothetical protein